MEQSLSTRLFFQFTASLADRVSSLASTRLIIVACLLAIAPMLFQASVSHAQIMDNDDPSATQPEDSDDRTKKQAPRIREAGPQTFYLKDEAGNLVPVPGLTYEELIQAREILKGFAEPERRPDYTIEKTTIRGRVQEGVASFKAKYDLQFHRDGWVRVPLRLNESILSTEKLVVGRADLHLSFEESGAGFVLWVKAEADKSRSVEIECTQQVRVAGAESSLALQLPRALTELHLDLPKQDIELTGQRSDEHAIKVTRNRDSSVIAGSGRGGRLELVWRSDHRNLIEPPPILKAEADLTVHVSGPQSLAIEAELTVSTYRGKFDSFRFQLPPGMEYIPSQESEEFEITEQEADVVPDVGADDDNLQTGRVFFVQRKSAPSNKPMQVRLFAEYVPTSGNANNVPAREIGGFGVMDAESQWGRVKLQVHGDWLVTWQKSQRVDQVALDASTADENTFAEFAYYAQPYSLRLTARAKPTRIIVEPQTEFQVFAGQVKLRCRMQVDVRGSDARSLRLDRNGWTIDKLEPVSIVGDDWKAQLPKNELELPITESDESRRSFELVVEAYKPIDTLDPDSFLELAGVRLLDGTVLPGSMKVQPADNVVLQAATAEPDPEQPDRNLQGLIPDLAVSVTPSEGFLRKPLLYRERGGEEKPVWRGTVEYQARKISVSSHVDARVVERSVEYSQLLVYQIQYEATNPLFLSVPARLCDSGLQIFLNQSEPLEWVKEVVDDAAEDANASNEAKAEPATSGPNNITIRVNLPEALIGRVELKLAANLRDMVIGDANQSDVEIPMAVPALGEADLLQESTATVSAMENWQIEPVGDQWRVDTSDLVQDSAKISIVSDSPGTRMRLALTARANDTPTGLTVRKSWIQSWIGDAFRRDRVVYRVQTNAPSLTFQLPAGASVHEVAVDQVTAEYATSAEGEVDVVLPQAAADTERTVELWIVFADWRWGKLSDGLESARLSTGSYFNHMSWQIAIPADKHLLKPPVGLASEQTWVWRGFYWGRQARLSQAELEADLGASQQPNLPSSANTYLFSTFSQPELTQLSTANRSVLAVLASVILFVFAMLAFEQSWITKSWFWLSLGIVLIIGSAFFPVHIVFVGQLSLLGLLLALASQWIRSMMMSVTNRVAPEQNTAVTERASGIESRETKRRLLIPEQGSHASTATAQMAVNMTTDSNAG